MMDEGYSGVAIVSAAAVRQAGLSADVDTSKRTYIVGEGTGAQLRVVGRIDVRLAVAGRSRVTGSTATVVLTVRATVVEEFFATADLILGVGFYRRCDCRTEHRDGYDIGVHVAEALVVPLLTNDELHAPIGPTTSPLLQTVAGIQTPGDPGGDRWAWSRARVRAHAGARVRLAAMSEVRVIEDAAVDEIRRRGQAKRLASVQDALDEVERMERAMSDDVAEHARAIEKEELERVEQVGLEYQRQLAELLAEVEGADATGPLGTSVVMLNDDQRRRLIRALQTLTQQLADPRKVPRRTEALALPVSFSLTLKAGAPADRSGVLRKFSEQKRRELIRQADQLAHIGLIRPAAAGDWASAVVLAKKSNGSWRFCVDYSRLNAQTADAAYPMPDAADMLREVAQHRFYSVYDLTDAFFQVAVEPEAQAALAFEVPGRGRYTWSVMPMGVRDAPGVFQQAVERMFRPLLHRGVRCFVDDLVVYADTVEELLRRTEQVHAIFAAFDLRVNAKKARLFQTSARILGRIVSHNRIAVDPEHVVALRDYRRPTTVHDMQRFLGLVQYHGAYIRRLGDFVAPLVRMEVAARAERNDAAGDDSKDKRKPAQDTTPLKWTSEGEAAFEHLRVVLSSEPVLVLPPADKLNGRVRVEADACTAGAESPGGVGGVVTWRDDDGEWRLVMAFSRTLSKAERKYTATEVELLGLLEVVKAARWILAKATSVEVVTDHQALTFIRTLADADHGRLSRWAARLIEHDLRVVYRPGRLHVQPDALSRAVPEGTRIADVLTSEEFAALAEVPEDDIGAQLAQLEPASVDVMFVDWPWQYRNGSQSHYRRMDNDELGRLDLGRVLKKDALLVWGAPPVKIQEAVEMVGEHLGHDWRLERTWCWAKPSNTFELFLCFARGPRRWPTDLTPSFQAPVRDSGRKPDVLYERMRRCAGDGALCVDAFARESREGWVTMGDERTLFDDVAAMDNSGAHSLDDWSTAQLADAVPLLQAGDRNLRFAMALALDLQRPELTSDGIMAAAWGDFFDSIVREWTEEYSAAERRVMSAAWQRLGLTVEWARMRAATVRAVAEADARVWIFARRPGDRHLCGPPPDRDDDNNHAAREHLRGLMDEELEVASLVCSKHPVGVPGEIGKDGARSTPTLDPYLLPRSGPGHRVAEEAVWTIHRALGHAGQAKVMQAWRRTGYWSIDEEDLWRRTAATCEDCQRRKGYPRDWRPNDAGRPTDERAAPGLFGSVHMDHVKLHEASRAGHRAILTLTDAFSRKRVFEPVTDESEETTARAILHRWVRCFGWPDRFVTDKGSAFANGLIKAMGELVGTTHVFTTAYHPEANGVEERVHRQLADVTAALLVDLGRAGDEWHLVLPAVELAINVTVNKATGFAPDHLLFGQRPRLPATLGTPLTRRLIDEGDVDAELGSPTRLATPLSDARRARSLLEVRHQDWDEALERARTASERMQERAAAVPRPVQASVAPGDYVMVYAAETLTRDVEVPRKFAAKRYTGPWRVAKVHRGVVALLTRANEPTDVMTATVQRCKKVVLRDDVRERYELWWHDLQQRHQDELDAWRRIRETNARFQDAPEDKESAGFPFEIEAIVGRGKNAEVRIRWDKPEPGESPIAYIPFETLRREAGEQLQEWLDEHPRSAEQVLDRRRKQMSVDEGFEDARKAGKRAARAGRKRNESSERAWVVASTRGTRTMRSGRVVRAPSRVADSAADE